MKEKLKSYDFWVSVLSAVMVVLQSLSIKFNWPYVQETVMGFLGILAVAGIVRRNETTDVEEPIEEPQEEEPKSDDEPKEDKLEDTQDK